MSDEIDVAMELQEKQMKKALEERQTFTAESEKYCIECEVVIPKQRRKMGGVRLCVFCQTEKEKKGKR